jgi:predicted ATPase
MNELLIRSIEIDWDMLSPDSWLHLLPAIASLDTLTLHRSVTFFAGENGSGKSTLLEAIAISCGFNPEGGTRNYCFSTYDSHSELCSAVRLVKGSRAAKWGYFLRAESFYNVATAEEAYSRLSRRGPEYYHRCSHGESFLKLMQGNFTGEGIYLLDEPEAALSPQRQLTLLLEISRCIRLGAQFIIATHSPILLGFPEAEILSFDDGRIHVCGYEDTESYRVTKLFLEHREQMLTKLGIG